DRFLPFFKEKDRFVDRADDNRQDDVEQEILKPQHRAIDHTDAGRKCHQTQCGIQSRSAAH
ncbi:MAG: hypothetical protein RLP11_03285, partial [Marinoscillum sp.]|uniref:hypothetical protein n=1 Tax=Marinoscillum sp. TaxID=2024838 RepID=UPI0032FF74C9